MDLENLKIQRKTHIQAIKNAIEKKEAIEQQIADKLCPFKIGDTVKYAGAQDSKDNVIVVGCEYYSDTQCSIFVARIKKNGKAYKERNKAWGQLKLVE